jgi:hypothetical protein
MDRINVLIAIQALSKSATTSRRRVKASRQEKKRGRKAGNAGTGQDARGTTRRTEKT